MARHTHTHTFYQFFFKCRDIVFKFLHYILILEMCLFFYITAKCLSFIRLYTDTLIAPRAVVRRAFFKAKPPRNQRPRLRRSPTSETCQFTPCVVWINIFVCHNNNHKSVRVYRHYLIEWTLPHFKTPQITSVKKWRVQSVFFKPYYTTNFSRWNLVK